MAFRSSVPLANFQHAHLEVEALVSENEDPRVVLEELKMFVAEELAIVRDGRVVRRPFREMLNRDE